MRPEGWLVEWGRWAAVFIFLGDGALRDIKTREISLPVTVLAGVLGILYAALGGEMMLADRLLSVLPGLILLATALISRGRAGMGDALTMLACSGFLSGNESLEMLVFGSIAAAIWSGVLLVRGRRGDEQIPFVPFLLVGAVMVFVLEVSGQT